MKKNRLFLCVYIVAFAVIIFNLVFFVKDALFYTIDSLPQGDFLYSAMSPDGNHTLRIFRVSNCLGTGIRGELITINDDGTDTRRNIYWQTGESNAFSGWQDATVVTINDINIDITLDYTYDCRREIAIQPHLDF